jgi:hypothetical protein
MRLGSTGFETGAAERPSIIVVPRPGANTVIRQGNLPSRYIQSNVSDNLKLSNIQIYTDHRLDHGVLQLIRD